MQVSGEDERDNSSGAEQIEQNERPGASPEERLTGIAGAQNLNFGLSILSIAAAVASFFEDAAWRMPTALVLGLLPLVLIYLVHRQPLLYAIFRPKQDRRTDLGIAFFACQVGLIVGNADVHIVDIQKMLEYAILVGLLCCTGLYTAARKGPQFWGTMFGMLILSALYGWGLAAALDSIPDKSTPANYTTTVVSKYESHGRGTTYHLALAPWGPMPEPDDVRVTTTTYGRTYVGEQVCLNLRSGVLRVQWYQLVKCDGPGK